MNKEKLLRKAKVFILTIGLIYTVLTILACISAANDIKNTSTTEISIGTIFSLIWFQLCVIAFMVVTHYMYCKKGSKGVIFEFIIALALILNVVVNMIISNATSSLVLLNFVIPIVMLIHSCLFIYGIYLQNKETKIKDLFNVK